MQRGRREDAREERGVPDVREVYQREFSFTT